MSFAPTDFFEPYGYFHDKDTLKNYISNSKQLPSETFPLICSVVQYLLNNNVDVENVIIFMSYLDVIDSSNVDCEDDTNFNDKTKILTFVLIRSLSSVDLKEHFPNHKSIIWSLQNDGVTPDDWRDKFRAAYGCTASTGPTKETTLAASTEKITSTPLITSTTKQTTNLQSTSEHKTTFEKHSTTLRSERTTKKESRKTTVTTNLITTISTSASSTSSNSALYIEIFVPLSIVIICIIVAAALIIYLLKCRKPKKKAPVVLQPESFEPAANFYDRDPYDPWEIQKSNVDVYYEDRLGSGEYGEVYVGQLIGEAGIKRVYKDSPLVSTFQNCEVAVKMLPPLSDENAKEEFKKELIFMKSLKCHPHVVSLLGYVKDVKDPMLLLEYCTNGNLLNFVQSNKEDFIEKISNDDVLTIKGLISFAWQISSGLEYLTSLGFVHRDVAARNILLNSGNICKIGDFGLCRMTMAGTQIYLSQKGKIAIRWMAIECLKDFEFSAKTDVWAFGVLTYEIFSFGAVPYENLEHSEVLRFLLSGSRLAKPLYCPNNIHDLMTQCWKTEASERPNFTEICRQLTEMLKTSNINNPLNERRNRHKWKLARSENVIE